MTVKLAIPNFQLLFRTCWNGFNHRASGFLFVLALSACILHDGSSNGDKSSTLVGDSCMVDRVDGCVFGAYCEFAVGTCETDLNAGTCAEKPEFCTEEHKPVCGCDGLTYGNACTAAFMGLSIQHDGQCGGTKITCGPDQVWCQSGQYCELPMANCGSNVNEGECIVKPDACTEQYDPVCGCDGKTYGNACFAEMVGINVQYAGECGTAPTLPPESTLTSDCRLIQPFRDALSFEENPSGTSEIQIVGDTASFSLGWSGGCEAHLLYLCWNGTVMPNQPVEILLHHNANDDPCEAYETKAFAIDLTPIKEAWKQSTGRAQGTGSITLVFASAADPIGNQKSVEYKF